MSPSGATSPRRGAAWVLELCLLGPSLAAGIGLGRLTDAPGAARVVAPVVVVVVTGQLVGALGRRLGAVASLVSGTLAVGLVTVWWFEPATVWWGLPTASTVHGIGHALSQAVTVTRASPTPVAAVAPVVLCIAAGAGFAAVAGRALLPWPVGEARQRALGWSLGPSAGLFAYAAVLSSGVDRVQATCAYIVALVVAVLAVDRAGIRAVDRGDGAGRRRAPRRAGAGTAVALVSVAVAVTAALASAPSLGATLPHVFLSATSRTGPGVGGGPASRVADTVALVDDVGSLLSAGNAVVLFTARSSAASYWQVASLTDFDGRAWRPPSSTWTAVDGLEPAGVVPAPADPEPAATFTGEVRVAGLRSTLLPVPPRTIFVEGTGALFDPAVGALRPGGTAAGTTYSFLAASSSPTAAGVAAPSPTAAALAPYLRLPRQPAAVVRLARRVVAGARTPFEQASALARFFDSGRFRYSLTATQGTGDPLESFLFRTHTGFCQQFAGAFAVLARIDGLPTRVAVGFDAGVAAGGGRYVVTTADAHVWPEVYLGPATGWVSFEPTPPAGTSGAVAADVVYGAAAGAGGLSTGGGSTVTTNPKERAGGGGTATSSPASASGGSAAGGASGRGAGGAGGVPSWPLVLVAVVVAGVLVLVRHAIADVVVAARTSALSPGPAVALQWRRAARAFGRGTAARGRAETVTEHTARMGERFPDAAGPYGVLSGLASRAWYSQEELTGDDVARARMLCVQTRRALRHRRRGPGTHRPERGSRRAARTAGR